MIPRSAPLIIALITLLGSACAHRQVSVGQGEREVLQQRERDFLAALGARDVDRTTAYFAEDALLHVASRPPLQGRGAIAQFYGNVFRFLQASEATPERMRLSSAGDLAYSVGRVHNTFAGEQGGTEFSGKYALVWEKRSEVWMIVLYSLSDNGTE